MLLIVNGAVSGVSGAGGVSGVSGLGTVNGDERGLSTRHQVVDALPALGHTGIHVYHLVKRPGFCPGLKRTVEIFQIALHECQSAKSIGKLEWILSALS